MPLGVELRLYDDGGSAQSNLTGIQACWWDVEELFDINSTPTGKSNAVTTDADGYIRLDLSNVSGLTAGDYGYLVLYKLDATDHRDSLIFAGKVQTSTVSSGVDMYYSGAGSGSGSCPGSGWTRPAAWLPLIAPDPSEQKFVGLHAVYEQNANFVALSAEGAYTVNWGDGTGNQNFASGAVAQTNILWANAAPTSDVGIAEAVSCTFQDAGDTVTVSGHNFRNGEKVAFSVINSTTGISTYTTYWVRDVTTNTFRVAATQSGPALALTTDGTGSVYRPRYRQVIVTLTMQSGQNLTRLVLHQKHTQTGLQTYSSGFLDITLAGPLLTDLRLGVQTPGSATQTITFDKLEQVNIVSSNLKQCEHLFFNCRNLRSVVNVATSSDPASTAAVTFQSSGSRVAHTAHGRINGESVIFSSTTAGTGITTYTRYFIVNSTADTYQLSWNYNGSPISLANGSGTAVYGTNFGSMFRGCFALTTIPLLDTSAGADFNSMFNGCTSLTTIPLLNTAAGTNFNAMFLSCHSLTSIPQLNTAAGTNFSSMFSNCFALTTIPLLNTSAGTDFSHMFNGCTNLTIVPLLNTSAGTNFSAMFFNCRSLEVGALSGTRYSISYANCKLSGAELNRIYSNLGAPAGGSQTITVTNNWGTASDNPALVPSGWTVSGS